VGSWLMSWSSVHQSSVIHDNGDSDDQVMVLNRGQCNTLETQVKIEAVTITLVTNMGQALVMAGENRTLIGATCKDNMKVSRECSHVEKNRYPP
jgi:hypothetical protein